MPLVCPRPRDELLADPERRWDALRAARPDLAPAVDLQERLLTIVVSTAQAIEGPPPAPVAAAEVSGGQARARRPDFRRRADSRAAPPASDVVPAALRRAGGRRRRRSRRTHQDVGRRGKDGSRVAADGVAVAQPGRDPPGRDLIAASRRISCGCSPSSPPGRLRTRCSTPFCRDASLPRATPGITASAPRADRGRRSRSLSTATARCVARSAPPRGS